MEAHGLYDPKYERDACGIGMIVNIKGEKSHKIITQAVEILQNLTHRGGVGAEPETGDGAGLLFQIPHEFFKRVCAQDGLDLPPEGEYGVAMLFASPDRDRAGRSIAAFNQIAAREGLAVLGARRVPFCDAALGKTARETQPSITQIFIAKPCGQPREDFERALYILQKLSTAEIRRASGGDKYFYVASASSKTIVYKGMLRPNQITGYYVDLLDTGVVSSIALLHSRYSTNTFPSWERAHPLRHIIHNGEINTIRGNANWMKARESSLKSKRFGDSLSKIFPVIEEDGSDSAMLDNFLQLALHAGYSAPRAVMMAIPEPWENNPDMDKQKRDFYKFSSCVMEPWDGPASIAFTDGEIAGATLDRNGLRPSRYYVTKDGFVILASEVGVLNIPEENIVKKDRLRPGRMLLIDTKKGRIIEDEEIKAQIASEQDYAKALKENYAYLSDLPTPEPAPAEPLPLATRQKIFGYTWEDIDTTLRDIATAADDPIGSMGYDAPIALLSNRPQLLYNYFKQLFAQVTNPPIDAIREHIVTSSRVQIGAEGNLLEPGPECCRLISHDSPALTNEQLAKLKALPKTATLPILFDSRGLRRALDDLFAAADSAIAAGSEILILSDRGTNQTNIPVPALLAVSGLHHHLTRKGDRTKAGIVLESGEPREVHHFAALVGYGANAVNPYLAYETIENALYDLDPATAVKNYQKGVTKNIVKVMSKMGISTVRGYHGAQIFEALGIADSVIDEYFTGTASRIGGVGLPEIEEEARARARAAFDPVTAGDPHESGGELKWRKNGEYHIFNPETIYYLQRSCRLGDYEIFKKFSAAVNDNSTEVKNIRGLLDIVFKDKPIALSEVEPAESIVKRFKTGAMSYGSISGEAHKTIAVAMNRLGAKSNTGEGGESVSRFTPDDDGDSNSAIKQVASGRFGVTINYLTHSKEIQIKMAQGAKPGEGGHLPGRKVYPHIAKTRCSTPGVSLISPPPHHDIYSIEDLAQLIFDLKNANRNARINVKLASEAGVGTIAVGVAKGLADVILISGYDGGTGAAPRTSIRHAGAPWELGVAETHQTLLMNGLRNRVRLETDGKLLTGRDVVTAALLGAEEFSFATAPLMVMGCDMMRVCNLDTCPVGVATQNPKLRAKFQGKPEHVENFMMFIAQEVRELMAQIGVRNFNDLIGRAEFLKQRKNLSVNSNLPGLKKADLADLSKLLYQPKTPDSAGDRYFTREQNHHLENSLDFTTLLPLSIPSIERGAKINYSIPVRNVNRAVGCILSNEITKVRGENALPPETITFNMTGSAGLSFGAFLAKGVTLNLKGDCNDYLGKGLSGGKIIVARPPGATLRADENVIIGNVAFYGATSGEAYIEGIAGERFCVRNSGLTAVAEGVGDHGCEYMTGGAVVILGKTGRNFAAGMSGGIAYVYDEDGKFHSRLNRELISVEPLNPDDVKFLTTLIQNHYNYTNSKKAKFILENFKANKFHKIIPVDYKKITEFIAEARNNNIKDAEMYAFDKAREA